MQGSGSIEAEGVCTAAVWGHNNTTSADQAGTTANAGLPPVPRGANDSPGMPEQRRRCMSDKFMLYTYKIKLCKRQDPHNWRLCPYAHPGEAGRRRPPHMYQAVMCDFNKTKKECSHGERCLLARNALEYWLHPDKYRTILCGHGEACNRNICFFAHTSEELRTPATSTAVNDPLSGNVAAATGAFQQLAIAPQTAGGDGGNSGQRPQLVQVQNTLLGTACSYVSGVSAPFNAAQGSQPQIGLPFGGANMASSHQMVLAMPSMGVTGSAQSSQVPGSGLPGYLPPVGTVVGAAGQMVPPMVQQQQQVLQVEPTQHGGYQQQTQQQMMPWGFEQRIGYQQQTQQLMMISGADPSQSRVVPLPGVDLPVNTLATHTPVQQQVAVGAAYPYYLMTAGQVPGSAQPIMISFGSAQQQYQQPQAEFVQQPVYIQQEGGMGLAVSLTAAGSGPGSMGTTGLGQAYGGTDSSLVTGMMPPGATVQPSRQRGAGMHIHAPAQQLQQPHMPSQPTGEYATQAAPVPGQYMFM